MLCDEGASARRFAPMRVELKLTVEDVLLEERAATAQNQYWQE